MEPRSAASARLTGRFCAVIAAESIAALRPHFVALANLLNLHDFDAAALKDEFDPEGRFATLYEKAVGTR